jgi:hypothetical protein
MPPRLRALLAALTSKTALVVLACLLPTLGLGIALLDDDGDGRPDRVTITVPIVSQAPQGDLNTEGPLKGSPSPATVLGNIGNELALVAPIPPAGAQTYSCRKDFSDHLYSSRNGIKPTEWILHYTAGNGTPRSILDYFARTRAANATFIMSLDGKDCIQAVPISEKPWTQLGANSYAISIELVTTGYNLSRDDWLKAGIFQHGTLAALMRDTMRANGIPLRFVDPVGCNFPPGYTDHNHLECLNNHTDVAPTFPFDVLQRQLTDSGAAPQPISKTARAKCTELNTIRRHSASYHRAHHLKPVGRLPKGQAARAKALRASLHRGGYRCTVGAPGKRGKIARR